MASEVSAEGSVMMSSRTVDDDNDGDDGDEEEGEPEEKRRRMTKTERDFDAKMMSSSSNTKTTTNTNTTNTNTTNTNTMMMMMARSDRAVPQVPQITEGELCIAVKVLRAIGCLNDDRQYGRKNGSNRKASDTKEEVEGETGLDLYKRPNLRDFRKALAGCLELQKRSMFGGRTEEEHYENLKRERSLKRQKMSERDHQRRYLEGTALRRGRVQRLQRLKDDAKEEEMHRVMNLMIPDGHVDTDTDTDTYKRHHHQDHNDDHHRRRRRMIENNNSNNSSNNHHDIQPSASSNASSNGNDAKNDTNNNPMEIDGNSNVPSTAAAAAPTKTTTTTTKQDGEGNGGDDDFAGVENGEGMGENTTTATTTATTTTTKTLPAKMRSCYVCKIRFRELHHFYDQLCPKCASLNWTKRHQTADLRGKVAVVTGSRVKIGYQTCLKLLRAGCHVVATTRFPNSSAYSYRRESDFHTWKHRLCIYGLDLRDVTGLEAFTRFLKIRYGHHGIDILINNACQTVRRPTGYYIPLVQREQQLWRTADSIHRDLLHDCLRFEKLRRQLVLMDRDNPSTTANTNTTTTTKAMIMNATSTTGTTGPTASATTPTPTPMEHDRPNGSSKDDESSHDASTTAAAATTATTTKDHDGSSSSSSAPSGEPPATSADGDGAVMISASLETAAVPFERTGLSHSAAMSQMIILPDDAGVSDDVLPPGASDVNGQQLDLRRTNSWLLKLEEVSTPEIMECMFINAIAPFVLNSRLKPLMTHHKPSRPPRPPPSCGGDDDDDDDDKNDKNDKHHNGDHKNAAENDHADKKNDTVGGKEDDKDGDEREHEHDHDDRPDRFIVNVSAMEGKFYRYKTPNHPHTNMAKAALNMMTRTSAEDWARSHRIYMNSVDTGWINDENPLERAHKIAKTNRFQTPIDEIDAAARILDPIFTAVNNNNDDNDNNNGDGDGDGDGDGGDRHKQYGKFLKDYRETEW